MNSVKIRKTKVSISQLFCLTAWFAVLFAIGTHSFIVFLILLFWSLSAIISWFITDSRRAIFTGLAGGIFAVSMSWLILAAVLIPLWALIGDLDSRRTVFFSIALVFSLTGSVIGGVIGSKIHYH
jgi:hypothetical protein